jgi:hypothetical protein
MPPHLTIDEIKGFTLFAGRTLLSGRGDELIDLARTNVGRVFASQRARIASRWSAHQTSRAVLGLRRFVPVISSKRPIR